MYRRRKHAGSWVPFVALVALACGPSDEVRQQLEQLPVVSAERDQLLAQVSEQTQFMGAIASELAKLGEAGTTATMETAGTPTPQAVVAEVRDLVAQVTTTQGQLTDTQNRVRSIGATNRTQAQRIVQLEQNLSDQTVMIENQRQNIAALTTQVGTLEQRTTRLNTANAELTRTVEDLTTRANTVWYVIGTKQELLDRGVIREEGGSRVLFIFGKRGRTLVPARQLDTSAFTRADRRTLSEIPLPDATASYEVVTPQDLGAVSTPVDDNGRVMGDALRITDRERFWANDRYLILVRT